MPPAFRIYVPQPVVSAFQDPHTYVTLGCDSAYGSPTRYIFQDNYTIDFHNISDVLHFLSVYCNISLAVVAGDYNDLNSTYEYIDGVCNITLLP
jgi:hypothetical protein